MRSRLTAWWRSTIGDRVGLLTYALHGDEFEVVTIRSAQKKWEQVGC
jgi:hypothetical protein